MINNKILTAEEARTLSNISAEHLEQRFLDEIMAYINDSAQRGLRETWYDKFMPIRSQEVLINLGYTVEDMSNQKEGYSYKILW